MLRLEDLSPDEYQQVTRDFLAESKGHDLTDLDAIYHVYLSVLSSWGIICPHPLGYRKYDLSSDGRWFDCTICGAACIAPR